MGKLKSLAKKKGFRHKFNVLALGVVSPSSIGFKPVVVFVVVGCCVVDVGDGVVDGGVAASPGQETE